MDAGEMVEWQKIEALGSGAFGKVYSAFRSDDPNKTTFAIKVSTSAGETNRLLTKEIDIHSRLTHPDIVRYVNSYDLRECGGLSLKQALPGEGKCVAMVLEYLTGKDIRSKIEDTNGMPYKDVQKMTKNMVSALLYLKEQGIVHRDVKPANIFIDDAGRYKLGDFGLAIKKEDIPYTNKTILVGSPMYMSHELLRYQDFPSYASDMWALGVVTYEAFHGSDPWGAHVMKVLKERVEKLDFQGRRQKRETGPMRDFINAALILDPKKRLTVEQAVGYSFLQFSKTSTNMDESFLQDLKEFGTGSRQDFYLWLVNKYPDSHLMTWAEYTETYDRLYMIDTSNE